MHRLVMWGFALALVPLSLAIARELIILIRTTILNHSSFKSTPWISESKPSVTKRN
jgi:hypothetical protein